MECVNVVKVGDGLVELQHQLGHVTGVVISPPLLQDHRLTRVHDHIVLSNVQNVAVWGPVGGAWLYVWPLWGVMGEGYVCTHYV